MLVRTSSPQVGLPRAPRWPAVRTAPSRGARRTRSPARSAQAPRAVQQQPQAAEELVDSPYWLTARQRARCARRRARAARAGRRRVRGRRGAGRSRELDHRRDPVGVGAMTPKRRGPARQARPGLVGAARPRRGSTRSRCGRRIAAGDAAQRLLEERQSASAQALRGRRSPYSSIAANSSALLVAGSEPEDARPDAHSCAASA